MTFGTLETEMVVLIVSVLGGFAGLSYQTGRKSKDIETLADAVKAGQERAEGHEEECNKRHDKIDSRLAEGSTNMALLKKSTDDNSQRLGKIEELLLDLLKERK